ncbi:uncharacterized protein LOC112528667 [Cynara cardunculus var. scolymus]|uniref:uncharacterized protein LOC112528667 n=1 Tax=Cynara cardunculus var. scolymus TaxID=59895 RepID=UPI000D62B94A|nr:uncharacterized protein LOC112528667 [Cynara cardunculus var. scolymus]
MEKIEHKMVAVNGINIHVAELGKGPMILFIHGFPELWYTWRHQILYLASQGYRAVAPDLRGYGDTTGAPTDDPTKFTTLHVVGDLVALINTLVAPGEDKVFVVGHDWGAYIAWDLCLYRPDKVRALVNMSVPFNPRNPEIKPVDRLRAAYGDDYYIVRFQEVGEIEGEFAVWGTERVLNDSFTYHKPDPLLLPKGIGFGNSLDAPISLPSWLSKEDLAYYTSKYEKTGFTGALNYYRALNTNWELTVPWSKAQVKVPVKFIVGDLDQTYHTMGVKEYIEKGGFKKDVPLLEDVIILQGVGHFLQEEKPDEINKHIHQFFKHLRTTEACMMIYNYGRKHRETEKKEPANLMEGIQHKTVNANGLNIHIAEKGEGPLVLLLHGFPELWYSWRHQILYLADHGYRAVAPDLRGYGDTTGAPVNDHTKFTVYHLVGDLIGLLDAITSDQGEKVFVVGHDWGAYVAWNLCLFRPDRVKALVSLSVPFIPWNPNGDMVQLLRAAFGEDHYIVRFQEPGDIEAELASIDTKTVVKKFLTFRNPEPFYFPKGKGFQYSPNDATVTLPTWLSEEDVEYFATRIDKSGITGAVNYYRALPLNWELTSAWQGAKVMVPSKFVTGDLDLVYHMPGMKDYIDNGGFQTDVPLLEEVVVIEGAAHFINQEKPNEINKHIVKFLQKF